MPDVDSDHVFSVGLLHHVVDGVAANEGDVDVVPRYNICVVVVYGVYEHDVRVVRGLNRERATNREVNGREPENILTA